MEKDIKKPEQDTAYNAGESPSESIFSDIAEDRTYDIGGKKPEIEKRKVTKLPKPPLLERVKNYFKSLRHRPKHLIAWGVAILLPIFAAIFAIVFGYDAVLFPASVHGKVLNGNTDEPISEVTIFIEDRFFVKDSPNEYTPDKNGEFRIDNLRIGLIDVRVESDGFETFEGQIQLDRGSNEVNIRLKQVDFANLSFSLKGDEDYDFSNATLSINGIEYALDSTGSVSEEHLNIGIISITFSSPDYKDFTEEYDLRPGTNDFGEIELIPTADVRVQVLHWLSEEPLQNKEITIGEDSVKTNKNGIAVLRDLEFTSGLKTEIAGSVSGFIPKDKTIELKQGINPTKLRLVPNGKVVYTSNRSGNSNVYISNLDGSEEQMLSVNKGDATDPQLSLDGGVVYFLSTQDNIKNPSNDTVPIPYQVEINGANLQKLYLQNTIPYNPGFFFSPKTMIAYDGNVLSYGEISGFNLAEVGETTDFEYFTSFQVTNDGSRIIYYHGGHDDTALDGMYSMHSDGTATKLLLQGNTTASDLSQDGNKILYTKWNEDTSQNNLWIYDMSTGNSTQITQGSSLNYGAKFSPDGSTVTFISRRDGKYNIYSTPSSGGSETKLTDTGDVLGIRWMNSNDYIFYYTSAGLYVIDSQGKGSPQLVTDQAIAQSDTYTFGPL